MSNVVRLPNGRYPPGQSGNLRGMSGESRKQLWEAQKLAAQNAPLYIREMEAIALGKENKPEVRLAALNSLLDRGGLRAGQDYSPAGLNLNDIEDGELEELIRVARERAAQA